MLRRAVKRHVEECEQHDERDVKFNTSKTRVKEVLGRDAAKKSKEKLLEKLVFGGEDEILESLGGTTEKREPTKKGENVLSRPKPAWEDEDDDNVSVTVKDSQSRVEGGKRHTSKKIHITGENYKNKLKNEFEKVCGAPTWARLRWERTEQHSEEDNEDLLKQTGDYLAQSNALAQGIIQMERCSDANKEQPSEVKLTSVQFHPTSQVVLTAGMDQSLHLFQVDGKINSKIQSIFLEKFPIYTARFSTDGREVVLGSRSKRFYYYDMIAGKVVAVPKLMGIETEGTKYFKISPDGKLIAFRGLNGNIHLVSSTSKELIQTVKMNGTVDAIAFNRDGSRLLSYGDDGEVYVWDMNSRQCIHRFVDEGCLHGTALAVSQNNQYIACGSDSGVVNIYDENCLLESRPKPLKAVMNLTTPCTYLTFNHQTEILAMASFYEDSSLKLVHLPSFTVFSNYPNTRDNIKVPCCMDFSTRSGYFSVGNMKGRALLYRVKHYENY